MEETQDPQEEQVEEEPIIGPGDEGWRSWEEPADEEDREPAGGEPLGGEQGGQGE